jgi:hypothetical protein
MTNGTFAGCLNGTPFNLPEKFPLSSPEEQTEMLFTMLERVVGLIDTAPFNREFLHVHHDAGASCWTAEGPKGFRLDESEIRSDLSAPCKSEEVNSRTH